METKDPFYEALVSRDRRFDGRFFVGVRTTKIYCRPICRSRVPLRKNVTFYPTAAAAEEAGFRPCMRCRPESAPGSPAWSGTSAVVSRALRLISTGVYNEEGAEGLARRIGLSERRLRQLFNEHVGASPQKVVLVHKLNFARQLIDQSDLPITEIAFASGFRSVRRFNDSVKKRFLYSPRALRKRKSTVKRGDELILHLPYRPPFDWSSLLVYLTARATPGVEAVVGETYFRALDMDGTRGWVEVSHDAERSQLCARLPIVDSSKLMGITQRLRNIFDLDADTHLIGTHLRTDPRLRPLVKSFPGLRVPGGWDGHELAVRTILGQQISIKGATTLMGRIVAKFGTPANLPVPHLTHFFPSAESLARADLSGVGVTGKRMESIRALSSEVASGRLLLDGTADGPETRERLLAIPGIGEWTAQYIAMRALRDPDGFPHTDLVIHRLVGKDIEKTEPWRPWRAYATVYLWRGQWSVPPAKKGKSL